MCYMSHVTHVTYHQYHVANILPKTQCVIYFWKAHVKYSSTVIIKMLHVTCVTCNMSHMLHVTNIKLHKLQTILPNTLCVIHFWKDPAKSKQTIIQHSITQHNTMQHNITQHNMIQHNTTPQQNKTNHYMM